MSNFRININDMIKNGIDRIVFDPSKVSILSDYDEISDYRKVATRRISYTYDDSDLSNKIESLHGFHLSHVDTKVKVNGDRWNTNGLALSKTIATKLRKKPNTDAYTDNSMEKHKERVSKMHDFDKDFAVEQFKLVVERFNDWYVEEQIREFTKELSCAMVWDFNDEKEIVDFDKEIMDFDKEIDVLKQKRAAIKDKKLDTQYSLMLKYINSEKETISNDLRKPLMDTIEAKRSQL